jgi:hypothetical protein
MMTLRSRIVLGVLVFGCAVGLSFVHSLGHSKVSGDSHFSELVRQGFIPGKPWNGGKPSAPIDLLYSRDGDIPAGEWVEVDLEFVARTPGCVRIVSRLRALDGLEIQDESEWQHPNCAEGEGVVRAIRVRAPEGVSGTVAVDLRLELESGRVFEVTRAVGFSAQ